MDFERWRQFRGPAFRRGGAEIVASLDVDGVRERPQVAGEALLIALDQGDAAGRDPGSRLRGRLLETGAIASDEPNKHRRVRMDNLTEYRRRQRQAADRALSDMVADSQRLGLHDQDPEQVRQALEHARGRRG